VTTDQEEHQATAAKLYSLLLTPIYRWIRVPAATLQSDQLQNTVRILSWTAPFAALVVHRLRLALRYNLESNEDEDSVSLQQADDELVTDDEDYNRPNPYRTSPIAESRPSATPLPAPPTTASVQGLPPLFLPLTQTQQQEDNADPIEEFSMDQDQPDPIVES
jgi:hypothetical protein